MSHIFFKTPHQVHRQDLKVELKRVNMNIFFIETDPEKCAKSHCDKHVVKMLLELIQLLYTAHILLKTKNIPKNGYKAFSPKHPTAIWVRMKKENYRFSIELAMCLSQEYTNRYSRIHSCDTHIQWLSTHEPTFREIPEEYTAITVLSTNAYFQSIGLSPIPLAMPDEHKGEDTIVSYRKYYRTKSFAKWTNAPVPHWFYFKNITSFF
jgi:hypothetical protein